VEPAHEPDLFPSFSSEDRDVAAPFGDELLEGIIPPTHEWPPARGPLPTPVEALDQREELRELRPVVGIHRDLVADERVTLAQRERRVEMSGVEERQRVNGAILQVNAS
jgi:hypothetical protein